MERETILPATDAKVDIYLIAKLLCVKTQYEDEILSEEEVMQAIVRQLGEIPYIPFPVALHTVDMAPYKTVNGEIEILLGRKPNRTQFQFLGGFLDPKDTAERAAQRELDEETDNSLQKFYSTADLKYLKSFFIDDSRYADSCHKVTTSFFTILVDKDAEGVTHGDDIVEVKWFKYTDLKAAYKAIMRPIHHELFEHLLNSL